MTGPADSSRLAQLTDCSQSNSRQTKSASIDVQRFTNRSVVRANGDLIEDAPSTLQRTLTEELQRSPAHLALDLRGVKRTDNAPVDALVQSPPSSRRHLVRPSDNRHQLDCSSPRQRRREKFFEIFTSVQDAWGQCSVVHKAITLK
jgi:hypothetical protein